MTLEYVPLLNVQRDLYALPRGFERFREYLRTMTGGTDELKRPLVAMNPMGKEWSLRAAEAWRCFERFNS